MIIAWLNRTLKAREARQLDNGPGLTQAEIDAWIDTHGEDCSIVRYWGCERSEQTYSDSDECPTTINYRLAR